jgi:hypothetical protein
MQPLCRSIASNASRGASVGRTTCPGGAPNGEAPDRTTITADGNTRSVRVVAPKTLRVPLANRRWHLVTVDVRRADRDVRLLRIATTR